MTLATIAQPQAARAHDTPERRLAAGPAPPRPWAAGNQAHLRRLAVAEQPLQARLTVGAVDDPLEHEADAAADRVMRMVDPLVSLSTPPMVSRKCAACQDEDKPLMRAAAGSGIAGAAAPALVGEVLAAPGRPLDPATQDFMASRFGADFSDVRIHTDARAAQSAEAVAARAYTVGRDVVFGAGQYDPASDGGRRLLAHELAHTLQQAGGAPTVRRACGAALGTPAPDCTPSQAGSGGWQFMFKVNCDELLPGEEAKTAKFKKGAKLNIHGFASKEGPEGFNQELSCHRANRIVDLAKRTRPDCTIAATFKHGASPVSGPGLVPDVNPPDFWRSVLVDDGPAAPAQEQPKTVCGPDATDWLIGQMVAAKKNAKVLSVRSQIDTANFFAPQISGGKATFDAMEMLEGQESLMIEKAWDKARPKGGTVPVDAQGRPRHTADANQQLGELSATFGRAELATAELAAMGLDNNAVTTLFALKAAGTEWKNLVGAGRPFDFKLDPGTMGDPKSANCPDQDCKNTITLCPGSAGPNCFEKDLPGDVFYAHVGGFVGFSENSLQLGSQWAQLQVSGGEHWDPPEDTQMIHFGFNLPTPLTRAGFCTALQGAKSGFSTHACRDCNETPPGIGIVDPK